MFPNYMVFFEQFVQIFMCTHVNIPACIRTKQQMLKNSFFPWDEKPNFYLVVLAVENKQSAVA